MTVRLHIERLVVEGLDLKSADAAVLEAAIADGLSARLADATGTDWKGFAVPALPSIHIAAAPAGGPRLLGLEVAAALYGEIKP